MPGIYGRFCFDGGDVYEGQFKLGIPHGRGKTKWKSGATFEGTYKAGKKHGLGEEVHSDGSRYRGEYVHGEKEGRGEYRFINGDTYIGDFKKGVIDGRGTKILKATGEVFHNGLWETGLPVNDQGHLIEDVVLHHGRRKGTESVEAIPMSPFPRGESVNREWTSLERPVVIERRPSLGRGVSKARLNGLNDESYERKEDEIARSFSTSDDATDIPLRYSTSRTRFEEDEENNRRSVLLKALGGDSSRFASDTKDNNKEHVRVAYQGNVRNSHNQRFEGNRNRNSSRRSHSRVRFSGETLPRSEAKYSDRPVTKVSSLKSRQSEPAADRLLGTSI